MSATGSSNRLPPYVSYAMWIKLLDALLIFTPDEITNSYYRDSQFSVSSGKKLRVAILFLGLIDERNRPTQELHSLIHAHGGYGREKKTDILSNILRNAYGTIFEGSFSLDHATIDNLQMRFEGLGVGRGALRHCISFFLHMASEAGIELSPHLAGKSRLGIGRRSIALKSKEKRRSSNKRANPSKSNEERAGDLGFDSSLVALLNKIPSSWCVWNADEKDKFIKALVANLDFLYPGKKG